MSENIKHECAVAFLRLRKSREYFASKYSTPDYALEKMTILLEKQHNANAPAAVLPEILLYENLLFSADRSRDFRLPIFLYCMQQSPAPG